MLPYEGHTAFQKWSTEKLSKVKGKDRKKFTVPECRRKAWDIAVKSAERAYSLSCDERKQQYTFQYQLPSSQPQNLAEKAVQEAEEAAAAARKKRKLSISPSQQQPNKKRRRKSAKDPVANNIAAADSATDATNPLFRDYCEKNKDQVSGYVTSLKHDGCFLLGLIFQCINGVCE